MCNRAPSLSAPLICAAVLGLEAVAPLAVSAQDRVRPAALPVTALEQLDGAGQRPGLQPVSRLSTRAELDGPRTLSVRITRPTRLRSVLQLLIRGTQFSAILHAAARGTFAGELRNLTLRQALEAVLFPSNLDYEVRGTVIRVFPRRTRTRVFPLDLVAVRRSWQSRADSKEGVGTSGTSDPLTEVDQGIRSLLSGEGRHYVDRRAGLVQVTDFPERLDQVGLYLEAIHVRAGRQVLLDVQVYRVAFKPGVPAVIAPAGIVTDRAGFLRSLESAGEVRTIASPRFFALNNEAAIVRVASDDSAGNSIATSLLVTPQISADGIVQLSVVPRVEEGIRSSPEPLRTVHESDTVLRMREGETVVFSGFRSAAAPHERVETIVLVTPMIVVPSIASEAGQR